MLIGGGPHPPAPRARVAIAREAHRSFASLVMHSTRVKTWTDRIEYVRDMYYMIMWCRVHFLH